MTTNEKQKVVLKKKKSKKSKTLRCAISRPSRVESRPSTDSTSEEELVESTKPTFYPHTFVMRPSQYECSDFIGFDMMGKLQEERFHVRLRPHCDAGLLQLQHGVPGGDSGGAVCRQLPAAWLAGDAVVGPLSPQRPRRGESAAVCRAWARRGVSSLVILFQSLFYYLLWLWKERWHVSYPLYFTLYALYQASMAIIDSTLIWRSDIPCGRWRAITRRPLTSVLPLMLMVIVGLKGHSFIFTNYGLEKQSTEHVPNSFGHYCYFMCLLRAALTVASVPRCSTSLTTRAPPASASATSPRPEPTWSSPSR